jgi:hypothetical protein
MSNQTLSEKLAFIGIQISTHKSASRQKVWIDIEKTIYDATLEIPSDPRLLSLLCSWVSVHGERVIVEKLMRLQKKSSSPWLIALAIFAENNGFHKWKRLIKKQEDEMFLINKELAKSSIQMKGEEPRMHEHNFLIPLGSIRLRSRDALTVRELARANAQYRNRLIYGAAIRSDVITAIEAGIETPYAIAKAIGCSYEPAHRIFGEYQLVKDLKLS